MKLSFSTLGCPNWSIDEVINSAKEYGFEGIEICSINGEKFCILKNSNVLC